VRPFEGKGKADVVNVGGRVVGRGTFEPGWRWSENIKPIAGTDSCKVSHLGHCISDSPMSIKTHGSSPTTSASCPGGIATTSPGPHSPSLPSSMKTFIRLGDYAKRG
jgi:hypothetical protein